MPIGLNVFKASKRRLHYEDIGKGRRKLKGRKTSKDLFLDNFIIEDRNLIYLSLQGIKQKLRDLRQI